MSKFDIFIQAHFQTSLIEQRGGSSTLSKRSLIMFVIFMIIAQEQAAAVHCSHHGEKLNFPKGLFW